VSSRETPVRLSNSIGTLQIHAQHQIVETKMCRTLHSG
jgi:hypothetical protein